MGKLRLVDVAFDASSHLFLLFQKADLLLALPSS